MRSFWCGLPVAMTLLLPAAGSGQSESRSCTPAALDHVPVAVQSLDRAQLTYERLGFRLKPGRAHANGLRNAFAKFPGGDYLELISPERGAVDALSQRYVAHLEAGEGGSALALRADSLSALNAHLDAVAGPVRFQTYGSAFATLNFTDNLMGWLFLIEYLSPVVDPPEALSHPNTAAGIETVWLTEQAFSTLPKVAAVLCLPALRLATGAASSHPVSGVTLRVRSVDAARRTLRDSGLDVPIRTDARGRSVVVPAEDAHGIFIEFLEPASKAGF